MTKQYMQVGTSAKNKKLLKNFAKLKRMSLSTYLEMIVTNATGLNQKKKKGGRRG